MRQTPDFAGLRAFSASATSSALPWGPELARAERDAALAEKTAQEKIAVTKALIEETVGREIDVRSRHAMIARSMQRMALERLVAMYPKELSPTLAFHMLRAGIQEERAALGLAELSC